MWKKLILITSLIFLLPILASAQGASDIEVYDIEKQQIVKKIPNTAEVQEDMQSYLQSLKETVPPLTEAPKEGKMVRIPLNPAVKLENQWLNSTVHEVFLILIPSHQPFIILYDQNQSPFLLRSEYDLGKLINQING